MTPPPPEPTPPPESTMTVEAEIVGAAMTAQIVRIDIPRPTAAIHMMDSRYCLDMCLTPRPEAARAGYPRHWGPHRSEALGDVFLMPPGEPLRFSGGTGSQASLVCYLDPALIHELVGHAIEWDERHLASTLDVASARIRAILLRLTEEVRHPGLASARLFEFLSGELAIEVARHCQEVAERPVTGGLSGWRLRLVEERLAGDPVAPSLEELAAICALSVRQLTRGWRVSRGCSIGDSIERQRMENAKRLLMAGESVKAVTFALGFAAPSSFAFAFRRAVGSSPSAFRQRQSLRGGLGAAPLAN